MEKITDKDFLTLLIGLTILFFVLGVTITTFIILYYKKRNSFLREKTLLKTKFEKSILQSELEIKENTLNNVSQEIHDNVGQALSVTRMQLNILGENELVYTPALRAAKDSLGKAMQDLRDMAKGLSSGRIQHFSLIDNIKEELDRIRNHHLAEVGCKVIGVEKEIPEEKKLVVFRMIQECLQNILKHANAQKITISFSFEADVLITTIQDDGVGFNIIEITDKKQGLGLQNIFQRANIIGGRATVDSSTNGGTVVKISIPYA
jgi:signal transduction histidine kinase